MPWRTKAQMMRKLGTVTLIAMIILVVVVAGTCLPVLAAKKPYEGVTLRVMMPKFVETEAFAKYGAELAEEMGMKLDVQWYTYDGVREKTIVDHRTRAGNWDIVYLVPQWLGEYTEMGILDPIGSYFNNKKLADPAFEFADLMQSQVRSHEYKGKLMSIPLLSAHVVLAYRTDLFKDPAEQAAFKAKYGYDLEVPKTYKAFKDVAEFFTRKKGEKLAGQVLDADFYGTAHSNKRGNFLWQDYISYAVAFGADVIFDPKTKQPTWTSPENIRAGKYYVSLAPFQPPGHINMTSGESCSMFANGRVAMIIEFDSRVTSVCEDPANSKVVDRFDYALLPSDRPERKHAYLVSPSGVGIYTRSKNKEASFKLIEAFLSKANSKRMMLEVMGYKSLRASTSRDPEVKAKYPRVARYLSEIVASKPYTFEHPTIDVYPQAFEICSRGLSEALAGEKSVEQAFKESQAELVELFRRAGHIK